MEAGQEAPLPVHRFPVLDSTNAEALRRLAAGDRAMQVICAAAQTAGRGRDGRSWTSEEGNLYASVIVAPPPGRAVGELAFVAALAVGDAILACCAALPDLRYKWPNDVLAGGKKLAGILIEGDGSSGLVIGIGLNVDSAPGKTAWPATCLRAEGADRVSVDALLAALADGFQARYACWREDGFAPIRSGWLNRAYGLGAAMRARLPDGAVYDGVFSALDEDGTLVLDLGAAGTRRIAAGEVIAAGQGDA
jgi:BirA family biotin operon repressor/biotin-[acetyl-CoA-carboxylase] ligase